MGVDIGTRLDGGLAHISQNISTLCTKGLELADSGGGQRKLDAIIKQKRATSSPLVPPVAPPGSGRADTPSPMQSLEELGRRAEAHLARIGQDLELMTELAGRYAGASSNQTADKNCSNGGTQSKKKK